MNILLKLVIQIQPPAPCLLWSNNYHKQRNKVAKSISDASWYQFTQWVDYFALVYQIVCVSVPPHFTTQDCSNCGTRVKKSLSTRTHQCPKCKTVLDRDHNAAINILNKGLSILREYRAWYCWAGAEWGDIFMTIVVNTISLILNPPIRGAISR